MVRKIVWTKRAEEIFFKILQFYVQKNKSNTYSRKLNSELKKILKLLLKNPFLGRKTKYENIRVIIKMNYKIFYKIEYDCIIILLIWDTRQNPSDLSL
jgi:plasmid stabilization system protein ParE